MALTQHSCEMFETLNKMRESQVHTDVVLRVKGKEFHAHRVILAASSRYFDAMFSSGMKESLQTEVQLTELFLTERVFEILLHFIYTSFLPLTEANVLDILEAADHLQISGAIKKCSLYILNNLREEKFTIETKLKICRVAENHTLPELHEEIVHAVALQFGEICSDKAFMENVTCDELLLLLTRNDLSVPSETFLFQTVISWIKADKEERLQYTAQLLDKVRLPLVDIMVLLDALESEEFNSKSECFYLVHMCLLQQVCPSLSSPFVQDKGEPRVASKALVSLSASTGAKFFNSETKSWEPFPEFKIPVLQEKPATLYTGNHLFLFDDNAVHQYQIDKNTWTSLPHMKNNHHVFQTCIFEDFLYVIGGSEVDHMVVSERFSFAKKTWQFISFHEEHNLFGTAVTVFKDNIYSIGGAWAEGSAGREVCRFDPAKNAWTKLEPTKHSHAQACAFVVNGKLYVAGGKTDPPSKRHRGLVPSKFVEMFDEENNRWYDVPQSHMPPNNYGAVEVQNRVYFILGCFPYNSGVAIDENEVYQIDLEDWKSISSHDQDAAFVYLPLNRVQLSNESSKEQEPRGHEMQREINSEG
ncbi:kelch-like protein 3 [Acropora millepora]|uniref:kelch-like protein 3 n=1 Tax=Acropora millepora TaxID=45264 RepID=UPI001CF36A71|nr:kelch-like protein 3 [Acropora millepora]